MVKSPRTRRPLIAAALLAALAPLPARAQPGDTRGQEARANALYGEAQALIEAGNIQAACEKFEQSQALDPAIGTEYFLADCYERLGRLALAHEHFEHVAELARQTGTRPRETQALGRAAALEPKLAALTVEVDSSLAGLAVTLDDKPLPNSNGRPIWIDPGTHLVRATATGRAPAAMTVQAVAGKTYRAPLAPPILPSAAPPPEPETFPALGIAAIVVGAAGAIGLGFGIGFGVDAVTSYDESKLPGACDSANFCTSAGLALRSRADTSATLSTGLLIAGGATAAVGALLGVLVPVTRSAPAQAWVAPGGGGIGISLQL